MMRDALYSTFTKVFQTSILAFLFGSLEMDRKKNNFSDVDLSPIKNPSRIGLPRQARHPRPGPLLDFGF